MKKKGKGFYTCYIMPVNQFGENWSLQDIDGYLNDFIKENNTLPNTMSMSFSDYCYFTRLFTPTIEVHKNHYLKYKGVIIGYSI
ncbi:hypothetical protein LCGC14_1222670 [marine sediment metagenome]|uniref:Uncharacterized protein n=1 Tax=marine sediment metagenome TaxID=412755 RepID=A0A0F9NT47_9ZZZZ|nr:hypothetical protein [bacterium]